ncbi:MAG: hypothetical protein QOE11_2829 [Solirubrobacteraceae bacterium]|nr:hypothetical protein [Solirubrobacteraceae bacterium]
MTGRGWRRLAAIACALVAVAVLVNACSSGLKNSVIGNCTATRVVLARTVPVLQRRFDVVELQRNCDVLDATDDSAALTLAGRRTYPSRPALVADVTAQLVRAGWTTRAGSRRLTYRDGPTRYTASVRPHSIAPALAFVTLANPAFDGHDPRSGHVDGDVPQRVLSGRQKLPWVNVGIYVPRFVPPGYSAWGAPDVADFDEVVVGLAGGSGDVSPALRSRTPPPHWPRQTCDARGVDDPVNRCRLWGTTKSGRAVYVASDDETADGLAGTPTALVDGTLVELVAGHNHIYVRPRISRADVLRIFDSLQLRNRPAR